MGGIEPGEGPQSEEEKRANARTQPNTGGPVALERNDVPLSSMKSMASNMVAVTGGLPSSQRSQAHNSGREANARGGRGLVWSSSRRCE